MRDYLRGKRSMLWLFVSIGLFAGLLMLVTGPIPPLLPMVIAGAAAYLILSNFGGPNE